MKKSILKLLIVITITSLVLMFFTGCISPETTEFEESKSPEIAELEEKIEALEEELAKEEAEDASPGEEEETPTIELEIYDGPNYSESYDMCVYYIAAIYYIPLAAIPGSLATGLPEPEIDFGDDDNVEELGSGRGVKVSVKVGESYTLTATNSEGTASDSITLFGECREEVAEGEAGDEKAEEEVAEEEEAGDEAKVEEPAEVAPETELEPVPVPIEKNIEIGVNLSRSGFTVTGEGTYLGGPLAYLGDWDNDQLVFCFFFFDISSLSSQDNVTIKKLMYTLPVIKYVNHPEEGSEIMRVYAEETEAISIGFTKSVVDQDFPDNKVGAELQKSIDMGKQNFILKFVPWDISANGIKDYYQIHAFNVVLNITYEVPG